MEARQDLAELACDSFARGGIGWVAQQLARDRRAADPAHDEAFAQPVVGAEFEPHLRRAHARLEGCAQDAKLGAAGDRCGPVDLGPGSGSPEGRRIAAQDQFVAGILHDGIEAPGLPRGAPGFAAELLDDGVAAEMAAGRPGQDGGDTFRFGWLVNGHSPRLWHRAICVIRGRTW